MWYKCNRSLWYYKCFLNYHQFISVFLISKDFGQNEIINNNIHKTARKSIFHFIETYIWIDMIFKSNFSPVQSKTIFMVSKFNNLYYSGLVSDDSLNSTTHFNGTMNSYWSNCKTMSRYITGNTDIVCQKTATWTGIRKYKIGTNRVFRRLYDVDFLLIIAGRIFLNYRL